MNISIKNAEGETVVAAPDMNLYTVADQVHKNHKVDNIEKLKREAIEQEDARNAANTPLTEEDVQTLADALLNYATVKEQEKSITKEVAETIEEAKEESEELKTVAELPSNNGVEDHDPEEGEKKFMHVTVNPVTGEHIPVMEVSEEDALGDNETFEEMVERVKNSDIKLDDSPFTEDEFKSYLKDSNDSVLNDITKDTDFDSETIKGLLEVTNRKMKGEEFNIYKALPEKIQKLINSYCIRGTVPLNTPNGNAFRNMVTEELIDEFITNIGMNRIQSDFSKELEEIFDKGTKELSESIVGYTEERSKTYREAAEKMEDPEKKAKLTAILDNVDEGYNLTKLKEYAKTCKIKKYDLERPDKIYRGFLQKYRDSKYNVYGIDVAVPIILRNLNKNEDGTPSSEKFEQVDVDAFFIAFCKQTANYDPNNNPIDHAYMYYLMYNCVFTDINIGESKSVSTKFLQNIKEVIFNLRERNDNFGRKKEN